MLGKLFGRPDDRLVVEAPFHLPADVDPRDRLGRVRGFLLRRKARSLKERAGQKRRGIRE